MDEQDQGMAVALARYQVISAYLALDPPRGQREPLRRQLASRTWLGPDGEPMQVSAETIRVWVRRYRKRGLEGLRDKPRPRRGVQALTGEQIELACQLKREVPERTLDRIIAIMEALGGVPKDTVRRSTLHRALQSRGLSGRHARVPDREDLDRFEAAFPNDLWQSDMLVGPWLPDPDRKGAMRRAYLYAFLDDHSRLLLYGRFGFKGDQPALELVFRRALQRYGICRRLYFDNGQTYRAHHMQQIAATLGIHRIAYTQAYRPMGHGKIEALNRLIRSAFLSELKASRISTLDELNEAFLAWADVEYNRRVHSETGEEPVARWRSGVEQVRWADEELVRRAFLWRETRSTDKAGLFSLFGTRYQVSASLAGRRVEVLYDPEHLEQVEIHVGGRFVERVRPFEVQPHRRPRPEEPEPSASVPAKPSADWLGHLVGQRRRAFYEPDPQQLAQQAATRRAVADDAVVALLRETVAADVFDETAIRHWLECFGPIDVERGRLALTRVGRDDHHIALYLEALRDAANGAAP